jgi:hypothetical protein
MSRSTADSLRRFPGLDAVGRIIEGCLLSL